MSVSRRQFIGGSAAFGLASLQPTRATRAPSANEYLIKGGYVFTMDEDAGDLPRGDVHVRDGEIVAVAPSVSAPVEVSDAEVIDASGMIVMPGFIDTHWHMWHAIQRNVLTEGRSYFQAKYALAAHYQPEDFYNSNRLALAEAIHAGFTTIHNFAHNVRTPEHADAEPKAWAELGMRGRYSHGWIDGMANEETIPARELGRIRDAWIGSSSPTRGLVELGRAVRGPMYTDYGVYAAEIRAARELGLPVTMHAGITPARTISAVELHRHGFLDDKTMLVHFLYANADDRQVMVDTGTSLSSSIRSELRDAASGGFRSQLFRMRAAGVNACLSAVDGNMYGPSSMFDAMATLWSIGVPWQGTDSEAEAPLTHRECLNMAIVNGAKALGLSDEVGTLTAGKRADLIMVRATDLNIAPLAHAATALVTSARVANVDTVMMDGRIRKRGGQLVGIDSSDIVERAARSLHDVLTRAGGEWTPREEI